MSDGKEVITHSVAETMALGEEWGRNVAAGTVIALSGDLGAGKTHLAKGIAAGLGVVDRVHSPTFALLHEYQGGRLSLIHLDLYRLGGAEEIIRAGLAPYLEAPSGVTVVEWSDRWTGLVPPGLPHRVLWRQVWLEYLNEQERRIRYEDFGA